MPRPIRWLQPHTRWFVTTRTLEARLLLVPSPELNERIGFWFGRALKRFPGIEAHALYVASNHLHVVVTDRDGSLSAFFGYFLGFVARVGAAGPYFFCLCVERRDRAASRIVRETA